MKDRAEVGGFAPTSVLAFMPRYYRWTAAQTDPRVRKLTDAEPR